MKIAKGYIDIMKLKRKNLEVSKGVQVCTCKTGLWRCN